MQRRSSEVGLGARLRSARKLADISCRELDELAGLTIGHTSLIETGRRPNIELRTADRLAHVLGVSVGWLSSGEGEAPTKKSAASSVELARLRPSVVAVRRSRSRKHTAA